MTRWALPGAVALTLGAAMPISSQEAVERWVDDVLPSPLSSVDERYPFLRGPFDSLRPVQETTASAFLEIRRRGAGPFALHRQVGGVTLRQPLGSTRLIADATLSHRLDSHVDLDPGALRSQGRFPVALGVTGRGEGGMGHWAVRVGGGREHGPRWHASIAGESPMHRFAAAYVRVRDEGLRLSLPEPGVEGRSHVTSSRSSVRAELRPPGGRLRGSAVAVRWSREAFAPVDGVRGTALQTVVPGRREVFLLDTRIRVGGPVRVGLEFRRSRAGADGSLSQNDQRAGRLFFGRVHSEGWAVSVDEASEAPAWRGTLSWGRAEASASVRLETWPFLEVWDQLGAIAYRLRGEADSRWVAAELVRKPHAPVGWSVGLQRLGIGVDGEDWMVGGFGFGRSNQRSLRDFRATGHVLAGELRLGIPTHGGHTTVRLAGSVPVHGSLSQATEGQGGLGGDPWGWTRWTNLTVGLSWVREP